MEQNDTISLMIFGILGLILVLALVIPLIKRFCIALQKWSESWDEELKD